MERERQSECYCVWESVRTICLLHVLSYVTFLDTCTDVFSCVGLQAHFLKHEYMWDSDMQITHHRVKSLNHEVASSPHGALEHDSELTVQCETFWEKVLVACSTGDCYIARTLCVFLKTDWVFRAWGRGHCWEIMTFFTFFTSSKDCWGLVKSLGCFRVEVRIRCSGAF